MKQYKKHKVRPAIRLSILTAVTAACSALCAEKATAANPPVYDLTGTTTSSGAIDLTTSSNWTLVSGTGTGFPVSTAEGEIPSSFTGTNYNLGISATTAVGDLLFNNNFSFKVGDDTTAATGSFTMNLGSGTVTGSAAQAVADGGSLNDLLLLGTNATSSNVVIGGYDGQNTSTGVLSIALQSSGNFDVVNAGATLNVSAGISGAFTINKTGPGLLILSSPTVANNSFSGGINISAGIVQVSTTTLLGTDGTQTINGGALRMTASIITGRTFALTTTTSDIDVAASTAFTINGPVTGTGNLNVNQAVATDTGTLYLSNLNTYTGATNLYGGVIVASNSSNGTPGVANSTAGPFGNNSSVSIANSGGDNILLSGGVNVSFGSLTGGGSSGGNINIAGGFLTIGGNNLSPAAYGGGFFGTGGVIKVGTGTLSLSGTDTQSLGLIINSGVVELTTTTNSLGLTAAYPTINTGALRMDVSISSSRGAILNSSTSAIDVSAGKTLLLGGLISGTGTLNVNGTQGFSGSGLADTGTLDVTPVTGITNTYSGGTNISAGTVDFQTIRGLPTLSTNAGPITMAAGTTFEYDGSGGVTNPLNTFNLTSGACSLDITGTLTSDGVISGSGQLVKTGSALLVLVSQTPTGFYSANTYTGGTNISAGTLEFYGENYELPATGTVLISSGTTFEFYNSASGVAQTLPAVPFVLAGNSSAGNSTILITGSGTNSSNFVLTLPGVVSGAGTLVKTGNGILALSNSSNNYTGGTLVASGILSVNSLAIGGLNSSIGSSSNSAGNLLLQGGTLQYTGAATSTDRLFSIGVAGGSLDASGTGPLTFSNTGADVSTDTPSASYSLANGSSTVTYTAGATPNITVGETISGANISTGTTITAINFASNTFTISNAALTTATLSNTLTFGAMPRTFTLTGTNTGTNTLGSSLADSSGGGLLSVVKTGVGTWLLSGSDTYSGGTNVSAGTLLIGAATALPAANNNVTVGTGATLGLANAPGGIYAVSFQTLTNTGLIDIGKNALDIQSGTTALLATYSAQVGTGYSGGAWNGVTGITSSAAAADSNHLTAVGVIANDNGSGVPLYGSFNGVTGSIRSTFDGTSPVDGDILVKYTYYGDTDLSGVVDGSDYSRIDATYRNENFSSGVAANPVSGWFNGDFNYDGVVDGSDYTLMDNAFNRQGATLASAVATSLVAGTGSAVPEPASVGLIGIAALGLLGSRRRCK